MKKAVLVWILLLLTLCACAQTEQAAPSHPMSASPTEEPIVIVPSEPEETAAAASEEPEPPVETPDPRDVYLVAIEGTAYRSSPDDEVGSVLGRLSAGTVLRCVEEQGDFMLVELADGSQVWCRSWYLNAKDEALASARAEAELAEKSGRDGFLPMPDAPEYTCIASALNCRAEPNLYSTVLYQIVTGTKVTVYGRDSSFFLCRLPNGKLCYCSMDWLSADASYVVCPGGVDLRVFLSGAEFDLLFASSNNITGHAMYAAIPILEEETAFRLLEAYQRFQEDGYTIKIYDAYRPRSAQIELFSIVQDTRFIADPGTFGSWHQRGRAVDMSLIDLATGKELEMPTPMHTFSVEAARPHRNEWTEEACKNVDYMTEVMVAAGFGTLETEWWHYEYTAPGNFLDVQIDLESLPTRPVSDYIPAY